MARHASETADTYLQENSELKADVLAKLESVCWDFKDSNTRSGVHGMHPYPAKFIPQIPSALVDLFHPGEGSAVLDPFCGSGTTLVEVVGKGLPVVGIDIHPLAALIAKVKTTPLETDLHPVVKTVIQVAQEHVANDEVVIPDIPNVDHWFKLPIQQALAALVAEINRYPDFDIADVLRVAFSSIVVRVSNQDSDTRYAAVEKNVTQDDVWTQFERAANGIGTMLQSIAPNLFRKSPDVQIINKDLLLVEPSEIHRSIGLVITSPPYPNAYEYWLYHKYRMFWLGMDPLAVREKEIGARLHYFKKNHQTEADFERQMGRCFWLLSQVMWNHAFACFVVGRSIIHGREIDNEAILERAARPYGFVKVGVVSRTIAANRKSFNPSHGKINREGILILRLEAM